MTLNYEMIDTVPYYRNAKGMTSNRLMDLVEVDTELNLKSSSGFDGIELNFPLAFTPPMRGEEKHLDALCNNLIGYLKQGLFENWNSNDPHYFMCSAGKDSRILLFLLKELEKENGKDWLGDIKIVCREELKKGREKHDSSFLFLKAVKKMDFRNDQYSVYNVNGIGKPDYLPLIPKFVSNSFSKPDFPFFDEVIEVDDLKRWVCVDGGFGGEALEYPSRNKCTDNGWLDLKPYIYNARFVLTQYSYNFKSLFMPYLVKPYLNEAVSINQKSFKNNIRKRMLQMLGDDGTIPTYTGHDYNWALTPERKIEILKLYHNSAFFERFKAVKEVEAARPCEMFFENYLDTQLFGLALTYEEKFGGN